MNIASLGGHAHIVGLTGKDEPAEVLKNTLGALKVKCDFVELEDYPTITKLRVMSRGQQLIRLDFEDKFENTDPELVLSRMEQALPNVRSVILSDYAKGALEHVQSFIQKERGKSSCVYRPERRRL